MVYERSVLLKLGKGALLYKTKIRVALIKLKKKNEDILLYKIFFIFKVMNVQYNRNFKPKNDNFK